MATVLDALVTAFGSGRRRVAVFDSDARSAVGLWQLDYRIPVPEIVPHFLDRPQLRQHGLTKIPLHEPSSAELSDEFIWLDNGDRPSLIYFDYARSDYVRVPIERMATRYPATRMRYWHPDIIPPDPPTFATNRTLAAVDPSPSPPDPDEGASADGEDLFQSLRMFVQRERDATRKQRKERYRAVGGSQFLSVVSGVPRARPAGRTVDDEGTQTCQITIPSDDDVDGTDRIDGFFPDMEILIDTHSDHPGFPVEGRIEAVHDDQLSVWIRWTSSDDHSAAESAFSAESDVNFRIIELVNPIPFDRQLAAIDAVTNSTEKRQILTGAAPLRTSERTRIAPETRQRLNQSQLQALRHALETETISCIHGPPGTGKTRTLVHLIREAVYAGSKVLVCAHSNQAIDNLLVGSSTASRVDSDSLHAAVKAEELEMARAGNNSTNELVKTKYADREMWGVNVVGATMSAAHRFQPDEFDLVVIDEASQASIPSSLIPFSKGERIVLAGDHRQLPPYVAGEFADAEEMEISLFEHFLAEYGNDAATMLRRQYRMNKSIARFPNERYYGGKLTHGERNRDWTIGGLDPLVGIEAEGTELQTPGGSYYNQTEVDIVKGEVDRLLKQGVLPDQIGVITPYSGQAGKITTALSDDVLGRGLTVATVDAFQGSQREAIIVSFVRSNADGRIGFLGFPTEGPRRLNVTLTRAKKRCVLVGNWETLADDDPHRDPDRDGSSEFQALRGYLESLGQLRSDSN